MEALQLVRIEGKEKRGRGTGKWVEPLSCAILCAVIVVSSISITQNITDGLKQGGLRSHTYTLIPGERWREGEGARKGRKG